VGVVIALDRQERGKGVTSAIQEVERDFGLKVANIVCLENLIEYLQAKTDQATHLDAIQQYRDNYGVK
jgi:orotate phosphoribosyltransferase